MSAAYLEGIDLNKVAQLGEFSKRKIQGALAALELHRETIKNYQTIFDDGNSDEENWRKASTELPALREKTAAVEENVRQTILNALAEEAQEEQKALPGS